MIDKDGGFTYSEVIALNSLINSNFTFYPNPVKNELYIQMRNDKDERVTFQVTDLQGKLLYQEVKQLQSGLNAVSIRTARFSKGYYLLTIAGKETQRKIFVKQ